MVIHAAAVRGVTVAEEPRPETQAASRMAASATVGVKVTYAFDLPTICARTAPPALPVEEKMRLQKRVYDTQLRSMRIALALGE